ncbi:hypothetical protein [Pseudoxanthomonas wuyuanensis]
MKSNRRRIRKYLLIAGTLLSCGISTTAALAAQTGSVTIKRIRTGWAADIFAIETSEAVINPADCPTPDGYISNSNHPGYNTYYAITLMAFSSGKPVNVIVSDTECSSGRPKIIGVYVTR